jgi:1,6-anhydro-N-acetylmuramate kinase
VDAASSQASTGTGACQDLAQHALPMPPALGRTLQALQQPTHDELARAAKAALGLADLYAAGNARAARRGWREPV